MNQNHSLSKAFNGLSQNERSCRQTRDLIDEEVLKGLLNRRVLAYMRHARGDRPLSVK